MGLFSKFSRSTRVFDLIGAQAAHLPIAAAGLAQLMTAPVHERAELQQQLHTIENNADESNHALLKVVNRSFVLPFDREDLYALTTAVDNCVDLMDEVGENVAFMRPLTLPDSVPTVVDILKSCARLSSDILAHFNPTSPDTREYWVEINQLENKGDSLYRSSLAALFENATDAIELLRVKLVVDTLEDTVDAFETLAAVVERIALKES